MVPRTVQHDNVREHNRHAVLRALQERRSASRADLARATGLSVPTVAAIEQEFAASGLLQEGAPTRARTGRPARTVALRAEARNVLAVDLGAGLVRSARGDLAGGCHRLDDGPVLGPGTEEALLAWLAAELEGLREAGTPISIVAVAVPGVVDRSSGRVRLAPALGWDDVPLADTLTERTGLEVVLENDVNAVALGELLHGAGAGHRHVVYLGISGNGDGGIGAGIVVDGALYRGAHDAAGEVGYSLLPGLPETGLDLGASGPLERHLGQVATRCVRQGRLDLGDEASRHAFERLADGVRLILHNLACALDPDLMVVAWSADPAGLLAGAVAERWSCPLPVAVRAGTLGPEAALRGLAHLARERLNARICGPEGDEGRTA
ncbi:MAG: ROK family transcriptional regulator [Trueperaceae bacterium]